MGFCQTTSGAIHFAHVVQQCTADGLGKRQRDGNSAVHLPLNRGDAGRAWNGRALDNLFVAERFLKLFRKVEVCKCFQAFDGSIV